MSVILTEDLPLGFLKIPKGTYLRVVSRDQFSTICEWVGTGDEPNQVLWRGMVRNYMLAESEF